MGQYVHKVSAVSRENPQQMVLALKLLSQECTCKEFLARAKDQLLSIGTGSEVDDMFESFNFVRSAKFNHPLREKGKEEKLSPSVVTALPRW